VASGSLAAAAEGLSLAAVLRVGLDSSRPSLPTQHWRTLRALLACRTPALGGHRYRCKECGQTHFVPHSCRNRHCPLCQGQAARQWLEQQREALLPVPYFHVVFTLPHMLNPLIRQNQQALYTLLFQVVSQTLLRFGQNRFGVQLGVTAVLHTWSQTLLDHYHLHCIVTGGGLSGDNSQWVSTPAHYLFPVRALSQVYRAKFLSGLEQLYASQKLQFHGQLADLAAPKPFARLLRQAARHKWVVYAKQPFAGPLQVLTYLSRYTHRVAISPRRLLALDPQQQTVTFTWKDYADSSKPKAMTLPVGEFLRRFCLHLLPQRFVKIRHYGFLGNRQRRKRVPRARELLAQAGVTILPLPQPTPPPIPACPFCGSEQLELVEIVEPTPPAVLNSS
jgi:hypothetical protein